MMKGSDMWECDIAKKLNEFAVNLNYLLTEKNEINCQTSII